VGKKKRAATKVGPYVWVISVGVELGVRQELNLRAHGRRVLCTLKNGPKDSPTGCLVGLCYGPDHSWSGGGDCHASARAPALAMKIRTKGKGKKGAGTKG